jgi:hypothetical protein
LFSSNYFSNLREIYLVSMNVSWVFLRDYLKSKYEVGRGATRAS